MVSVRAGGHEVGCYLVDRGPPAHRENPGVKLFCLEPPWENPGDGQLSVYGGMCGREREGMQGGRRGKEM